MLSRIEYLHNKSFLHRDIKPENFLIGKKENSKLLYMIDYGLSKRYRDASTKIHIPYKDNKTMNGTARYASINTHLGIEQSRRDDLESMIYSLLYLMKGSLPWQNLQSTSVKEKYDRILQKKMEITPEALCKGLPSFTNLEQFIYILHYVRGIEFEEKPDYLKIKKFLHEIIALDSGSNSGNLDFLKPKVKWIKFR